MRQLSDVVYRNGNLYVPPTFPRALKLYAKAAIRTQPYDLLLWSASYFKALSVGEAPPTKARLELPPILCTQKGLTLGYLKILVQHFKNRQPTVDQLHKLWISISLDDYEFQQILHLSKSDSFKFNNFVAIAAGFLCKSLTHTMITLCEVYSEDGGSAAIPSELFLELYHFLAPIDASIQRQFYGSFKESNDSMEDIVKSLNMTQKSKIKAESCKRDFRTEDSKELDPDSKGVVNPVLKGLLDKMMLAKSEILVPPIPGIGPPVDRKTVQAFSSYAAEAASRQQHMFLPRNIRHYLCPPLHTL